MKIWDFKYLNIILFLILPCIDCKSEQGKIDVLLTELTNVVKVEKTLFRGAKIFLQIICAKDGDFNIYWTLTERLCWEDKIDPDLEINPPLIYENYIAGIKSKVIKLHCGKGHNLILDELEYGNKYETSTNTTKKEDKKTTQIEKANVPVYTIPKDGIYDFALTIDGNDVKMILQIEIQDAHGYLSAVEWPLLPFYGVMCFFYVVLGLIWLLVSFAQWRHLLRIQFCIGGVILLGILEKALFYAEYQNVNSTGISVQGTELAVEIVSCARRTLGRMLVIIISLGFGIVKTCLGPMLHRVIGIGGLYFILASVECYLRVMRIKNDHELLVASIPLAVLDFGICWWICTALVQTIRTLKLIRNKVKLSLYRHFTNTLIFFVLASVFFMLYSIKAHKTENCSLGWKYIWIDIAFWHVLFSVLLLVIMVLWRPTNNQKYAFTQLLDNPENEAEVSKFYLNSCLKKNKSIIPVAKMRY